MWYEAAAAEGGIYSLYQLGLMMMQGHSFDQNERTRAEAFRLITVSATLLEGVFNVSAVVLASFLRDSHPIALHYLRPAVEAGDTNEGLIDVFALGLLQVAIEYYGERGVEEPGLSPIPEALFWHRRRSSEAVNDADDRLVRLESVIRETCAHCAADLPEGRKSCCVECKAAYYCGRDCQMAHWKAGHKKDCVKKLKKRLRAANGTH